MSFANDTTKTKPRLLTVAASIRNHPRITLSGAWLRDWGFNIGDNLSLLSVEPGNILVRTGTWPEWPEPTEAQLNEPALPYPSADRNGDDLRSYYLYTSPRETPEIILTGAWLSKWGFAVGDRIQLTWKRENYFHIQVAMRAKEWQEVKRKDELVGAALYAVETLAFHRNRYPALYVKDKNTLPPPPPHRKLPKSKSPHCTNCLWRPHANIVALYRPEDWLNWRKFTHA